MTADVLKRPRHKDPRRAAYMREYLKGWQERNRDKQKEACKGRYRANKAAYIQRARKWDKDNPEKKKLSRKRTYPKQKARLKKWIAENKERHDAYQKRYYKTHYSEYLLRNHTRRALQRKATVNLAGIKRWMKSVTSKPTCACYYCQSVIKTTEIHWEHIIPLSRGGSHSVENLCVSCPSCNLKKATKSVQAFIVTGQQILSL